MRPTSPILALLALTLATSCSVADEGWLDALVGAGPPDETLVAALPGALDAVAEAWPEEPPEFPETGGLLADRAERVVVLSVRRAKSRIAHVATARERGLAPAILSAYRELVTRSSESEGTAGSTIWRLDVVHDVARFDEPDLREHRALRRGVAFSSPGALILLDELLADGAVDSKGGLDSKRLERARERRGAEGGDRLDPSDIRWRFSTLVCARSNAGELRTRRSPTTARRDHEALTVAECLASARAGADYLRRAVREDGRFDYSYWPSDDRTTTTYNLVRHAGTIYAMFESFRVFPDPALRAAGRRAIGFLLARSDRYPSRGDDDVRYVAYGGKIKLGGVALAALALVEHRRATGSREHDDALAGFMRYLCRSQFADGRFLHQRSHPDLSARSFESQYYPGEAIFALVRGYQELGDKTWIDAADRAAEYLISVRDRGVKTLDLTHDHWLLYGLRELCRERSRPLFVDHARRIVTAISSKQRIDSGPPEWAGSYYSPPRSTPTATRTEGLLAAVDIARLEKDDKLLELARRASERGLRFQLRTQLSEERAMFLPDARRAVGGFTRALDHLEVRIDYVQHNVSALLAFARGQASR